MELNMFFVDGLLLVALVALFTNIGLFLSRFFAGRNRALLRLAARFERRHPVLCDEADTFYCFFRRDVLWGN